MEMIVELLNRRFDNIDVRLDDLTEQVRQTNGRVRNGEQALASLQPRVTGLDREMRDVKSDVKTLKQIKEEGGENRRIRAWDVWVVTGTIIALLGFLKMIGKLG